VTDKCKGEIPVALQLKFPPKRKRSFHTLCKKKKYCEGSSAGDCLAFARYYRIHQVAGVLPIFFKKKDVIVNFEMRYQKYYLMKVLLCHQQMGRKEFGLL
jgi:hypothetical protein